MIIEYIIEYIYKGFDLELTVARVDTDHVVKITKNMFLSREHFTHAAVTPDGRSAVFLRLIHSPEGKRDRFRFFHTVATADNYHSGMLVSEKIISGTGKLPYPRYSFSARPGFFGTGGFYDRRSNEIVIEPEELRRIGLSGYMASREIIRELMDVAVEWRRAHGS